MIKIIDGVAYESKSGNRARLVAHDLGNGHLEAVAMRERVWSELDWSPMAIEMYLEAVERHREETAEDRAAKSLEMAARRAAGRVRRLCKVMGADTMITGTYRANQCDLALCKRHVKEFVRRASRQIKDFRVVVAFEPQERGAWHFHAACERISPLLGHPGAKVKSFNLLRAIWRSVVGELGGNIDVSQGGNKKRSPARIAAYLSKYLMKAFEDGEKGSNRWTKYGEVEVPKPLQLGAFEDMRAAVAAAYELVDGCASVVNQYLGRWSDVFFIVVENQSVGPVGRCS